MAWRFPSSNSLTGVSQKSHVRLFFMFIFWSNRLKILSASESSLALSCTLSWTASCASFEKSFLICSPSSFHRPTSSSTGCNFNSATPRHSVLSARIPSHMEGSARSSRCTSFPASIRSRSFLTVVFTWLPRVCLSSRSLMLRYLCSSLIGPSSAYSCSVQGAPAGVSISTFSSRSIRTCFLSLSTSLVKPRSGRLASVGSSAVSLSLLSSSASNRSSRTRTSNRFFSMGHASLPSFSLPSATTSSS
mmetsp:Transcript_33433/g.79726  ORF Transcript_33433/g.79726 Transcript_33433/m.79726 type:complete len:247 (-) Transcript_33433:1081-1821(-)